ILTILIVGIGMVYSFSSVHFFELIMENNSIWQIAFMAVSGVDFPVTIILYSCHTLSFILYIKWLGLGFSAVGVKCERIVATTSNALGNNDTTAADQQCFLIHTAPFLMDQVDHLKSIVDEFNCLFQVPFIVWHLTTGALTITQ